MSEHFQSDPPQRVLIVRFGRLGDLLMLTPALRALQTAWPGVEIDLLTNPAGSAALAGHPRIRDVSVMRVRRLPPWCNPEALRLLPRLAARNYDLLVLPETVPHYHRLAERIPARATIAFARRDRAAGTYEVVPDLTTHFLSRMNRLLALAGIEIRDPRCELPVDAEAQRRAEDLLRSAGVPAHLPLVGMHVTAYARRSRWRRNLRLRRHPKDWPLDRFAAVAGALARRGPVQIVFTGTARERGRAQAVRRLLPGVPTFDLCGKTDVHTLGAVLGRMRLFVCPDTGPAHVAAAVDTPLIAMHSLAAPELMGAQGPEERIRRLYAEPSAAGLLARRRYHPRMWALQPEDVLAAVDELGIDLRERLATTAVG